MKNINKIRESTLAQLLIDENVIELEKLESAEEERATSEELLIDIVLENDYVDEIDLAKVLVKNYQLPFIYPADYQVSKDVQELLPATYLHTHVIYPLDIFDKTVTFVTSGNIDENLIQEIEEITEKEVTLFIGLHSAVKKMLSQEYPLDVIATEVSSRMDELFGDSQ
jgi:hypothetical protein